LKQLSEINTLSTLYKIGDRRPHVSNLSPGDSHNFAKQIVNIAPALQYVNSTCFFDKIIKLILKLL